MAEINLLNEIKSMGYDAEIFWNSAGVGEFTVKLKGIEELEPKALNELKQVIDWNRQLGIKYSIIYDKKL